MRRQQGPIRNRGIGRARMFLGALLLLATVLTWGTGLMMSPHGETVVKGTEHVRTTIVTFKRNGAIGTLILCALAAWLLFPRRRPTWPARDWVLIVLLAILTGSSIYTLIWLPAPTLHTFNGDENLATTNMNINWNVGGPASDLRAMSINAAPASGSSQVAVRRAITAAAAESNDWARPDEQGLTTEANVPEEDAGPDGNAGSYIGGDEPANEETDENQE